MDNMYFKNKNEFENFLQYLTIIGIGGESTCYRLNKRVIKYLNGPYAREFTIPEIEYYCRFNKYSSFIFSDGAIIINNQVKGLLMPYIKGTLLINYNFNEIELPTLISKIKTTKDNILSISQEGVELQDLASVNIIVNNDLFFNFIDTNNYTLTEDINLPNKNIYYFNFTLFKEIFRRVDASLDEVINLDKNFTIKDVYHHFDEFLISIYKQLLNTTETPKVKDVKKLIKRP